jgi:hypothetical protein
MHTDVPHVVYLCDPLSEGLTKQGYERDTRIECSKLRLRCRLKEYEAILEIPHDGKISDEMYHHEKPMVSDIYTFLISTFSMYNSL